MSPFLTGVETEEDFRNNLRDEIKAINKTTKLQSPSRRRGLDHDGGSPDPRPKKQQKRSSSTIAASRVRWNNDQMEWLDEADAQWKRAGYHRHYRAQFLAFSAQQPGAYPWTQALGTNQTSFSPLTQGWTQDPDSVLDSKGRRVFTMEEAPVDWIKDPRYGPLTYNGLIMLDLENRAVRDIPGLPLTLATKIPGWFLEGLRRCARMEIRDLLARYPNKTGYSTLTQAMKRWMEDNDIRKWNERSKPESTVATSDLEGSTTPGEDSSPIITQMQSGNLNGGSSGQERPSSRETLSQSTCAYGAAYSRTGPYYSAVGESASYPFIPQVQSGSLNIGSPGQEPSSRETLSQSTCAYGAAYSRTGPYYSAVGESASYPFIPQVQSGSLNIGSPGQEPSSRETLSQSTCAYGAAYSRTGPYYSAFGNSAPPPWNAESSANPGISVLRSDQGHRHREGRYSNVPETSYYDQMHTESVVRKVIDEQRKQASGQTISISVMPQTASLQPLPSLSADSRGSLFPHGDFYSSLPTNIVENNFVLSMLEYTRSHYRSLMSREPPATTFGATYISQYGELQTHLEQLWPYQNTPPELRAVVPVAGRFY